MSAGSRVGASRQPASYERPRGVTRHAARVTRHGPVSELASLPSKSSRASHASVNTASCSCALTTCRPNRQPKNGRHEDSHPPPTEHQQASVDPHARQLWEPMAARGHLRSHPTPSHCVAVPASCNTQKQEFGQSVVSLAEAQPQQSHSRTSLAAALCPLCVPLRRHVMATAAVIAGSG